MVVISWALCCVSSCSLPQPCHRHYRKWTHRQSKVKSARLLLVSLACRRPLPVRILRPARVRAFLCACEMNISAMTTHSTGLIGSLCASPPSGKALVLSVTPAPILTFRVSPLTVFLMLSLEVCDARVGGKQRPRRNGAPRRNR